MRTIPPHRVQAVQRRHGLAPLEVVLVLPLLMFTMALMVNFGTLASWKVRASTAARQAAWRSRFPMQGAGDPKPENWFPQSATMDRTGAGSLPSTDLAWNRPQINQPFARGPVITEPTGRGLIHTSDARLYAMAEGMSSGRAQLTRIMPLLPALGNFRFNTEHQLLDGCWQFADMNYGGNNARRGKGWYNVENPPEVASLTAAFRAALVNLQANPFHNELDALDRDQEFAEFYRTTPDFHPFLPWYCEIDPRVIQLNLVVGTPPHGGNSIQRYVSGQTTQGRNGVPNLMANAWIRLYEDQINLLRRRLADIEAQIDALQAQIDALRAEIAMLRMRTPVDDAAIARLEAEIARLTAEIARLSGEASGLKSEIARLQEIIDTQLIPFRNSLS